MAYQKKSEYVERLETAAKAYTDVIREMPIELRKCNSSQRHMASILNINANTLTNWLKDPGQVPPNKLTRVYQFFNIFESAKR